MPAYVITALDLMLTPFVFAIGLAVRILVGLFVHDRAQTSDAVLRGCPWLGIGDRS
ncbi:MAG: hypothetical protein ACI8Z1_001237 [Candidatus Azotimanducaceae bacterium]|jgi:hypothetical protein